MNYPAASCQVSPLHSRSITRRGGNEGEGEKIFLNPPLPNPLSQGEREFLGDPETKLRGIIFIKYHKL